MLCTTMRDDDPRFLGDRIAAWRPAQIENGLDLSITASVGIAAKAMAVRIPVSHQAPTAPLRGQGAGRTASSLHRRGSLPGNILGGGTERGGLGVDTAPGPSKADSDPDAARAGPDVWVREVGEAVRPHALGELERLDQAFD